MTVPRDMVLDPEPVPVSAGAEARNVGAGVKLTGAGQGDEAMGGRSEAYDGRTDKTVSLVPVAAVSPWLPG